MRPALFALTCMLTFGCEVGSESSAELSSSAYNVVAGTEAADPAVAYVVVMTNERTVGSVCSGTLIDAFATSNSPENAMAAFNAGGVTPPRFVLTARHCIRRTTAQGDLPAGHVYPPEQIRVSFSNRPNIDELSYRVVAHAFHPDSDIAMLELATAVDATPIPLNGRPLEQFVGQEARVAGFGITDTGAGDAGTKRQGTANILSATTAGVIRDDTRQELDTNNDIAILGQGRNGQTICSGDSGGPQFLDIGGIEYVAAVTSFSYGPPVEGGSGNIPDCGHPDTVAGVVRVDKNIEWIRSFIRDHGGGDFFDDEPVDAVPPGAITGGCSVPAAGQMGWVMLALAALIRRRRSPFFE